MDQYHNFLTLNYFLEWKNKQNEITIGGKIRYDVGYYKYLDLNELFEYWNKKIKN